MGAVFLHDSFFAVLVIYTNQGENPITWGKGNIFNRFLILYLSDEKQ